MQPDRTHSGPDPMTRRLAITREVPSSIQGCELTHLDREPIDFERARAEHAEYLSTLETLGCKIVRIPADEAHPDCVFIEDTAIILRGAAIMMRPGAASRRGELGPVREVLARHLPLRSIEAPATMDGGDVLVLGMRIFVGLSTRSTTEGIAELADTVADLGYQVQGVPIRSCLHLKSAVTQLGPDLLLANPEWVDLEPFAGFGIVEVDTHEPDAANVVRIGSDLIHAEHFPRTRERILAQGLRVHPVPAGELAKAEGAVTCCSLILEHDFAVG